MVLFVGVYYMSEKSTTINVIVNADIYYRFYKFERFYRARGLVRPIVFACLFTLFATICIIAEAHLPAAVLLIVGLGLPFYNIWNFFRMLKLQIKAFDLENPKPVYSLHFSEKSDGIEVTNHGGGDGPLVYEWNNIHAVYRVLGCIYFYVLPDKAFLLPDGQAAGGDEALWEIITKMTPAEKIHDRRKH